MVVCSVNSCVASKLPTRITENPVMLSRIFSTLVLATAVVLCGHGCRAESVGAAQSEAATTPVAGALSSSTNVLPSWNDGRTKKDILYFVWRVTREGGPDFVPPEARIAVFDNDGTLWSEQPIYVQAAFALDRVKALAPQHPDWKNRQPFKGVLKDDMKAVAASGERGLLEIISATHAGMTTQQFEQIVRDWIATARHPKTGGIHRFIGRRPILAFGNSDSDLQMLQWTAGGTGARFMGLVHHTDAAREVAYDRASPVGKLDAALDEARSRDWTIVNMKDDWRTVYPR